MMHEPNASSPTRWSAYRINEAEIALADTSDPWANKYGSDAIHEIRRLRAVVADLERGPSPEPRRDPEHVIIPYERKTASLREFSPGLLPHLDLSEVRYTFASRVYREALKGVPEDLDQYVLESILDHVFLVEDCARGERMMVFYPPHPASYNHVTARLDNGPYNGLRVPVTDAEVTVWAGEGRGVVYDFYGYDFTSEEFVFHPRGVVRSDSQKGL